MPECDERKLPDILGYQDREGTVGSIDTLNSKARAANGLLEERIAKVFHEIAGE